MVKDRDRALRLVHEMDGLEMSAAIDDFGTGFSSRGDMRDFPIRTLKIHPSFVREILDCALL